MNYVRTGVGERDGTDAIAAFRRRLRETFADCLQSLYPEIEARTVDDSKLVACGILREETPDPNDLW